MIQNVGQRADFTELLYRVLSDLVYALEYGNPKDIDDAVSAAAAVMINYDDNHPDWCKCETCRAWGA